MRGRFEARSGEVRARGQAFGDVRDEDGRKDGDADPLAAQQRQPEYDRFGDPVEHRAEHEREAARARIALRDHALGLLW